MQSHASFFSAAGSVDQLNSGTPLCFPEDNTLFYNDDYESLMQFVKRNKTIPTALESFENSADDLKNINHLLDTIKNGDLTDDIFFHPSCQLYSIYLLKQQQITSMDFLAINQYLMALMQFTDKQSVRVEDADIQYSGTVPIRRIDDIEHRFILHTISILCGDSYLNFEDVEQRLRADIQKLSKLDRSVIAINKIWLTPDSFKTQAGYFLLEELTTGTPLAFSYGDEYLLISPALINCILSAVNPDRAIKMAPVFGSTSVFTLYRLHQLGYHPVLIYSKYIASNPHLTHEGRLGPLGTLLHDTAAHMFFSAFLTKNEREFIFSYLIPTAAKKLNMTLEQLMSTYVEDPGAFKPHMYHVIDLNIRNGLPNYKSDREIYLTKCLQHAFGNVPENDETTPQAHVIFNMLMEDKEYIQATYDIDIVFKLLDSAFNDFPFMHEQLTSPRSFSR